MKLIVSYTYLTEGGNRHHCTDVVEVPRHQSVANVNEMGYLYIRNEVSSEAVLLGVWATVVLTATVIIDAQRVKLWEGIEDGY